MSEKVLIECDCCGHLLYVSKDEDDNSFYLAMYSYGGANTYGFWKRLKYAWKLFRTGEMFSDQLVLSQEEAARLAQFFMLNTEQKAQECDATDDEKTGEAGTQNSNTEEFKNRLSETELILNQMGREGEI